MRSVLTGLTTRGTSFLTAGVAAVAAGLLLGERSLLSVGVLLIALPLLAALTARQARYRLSCQRTIRPLRVQPGQSAEVTLRLDNAFRFPSGLMLAQDTVPYTLGIQPRYVLAEIERGGSRLLTYPLRSDLRGKFQIGPLDIRITDAFGLVELRRSFASRSTLLVTPHIVPLDRTAVSGSWLGDGGSRARTAAAAGDDDVVPRAYRDGDELRRVHWRSTARYGQLMVRREEQRWRNRAVLLLDTRRGAHAGSGTSSSFEFAVSAAASIGVHLAGTGLDGQLVTDAGPVTSPGRFEDVLLDSLSVVGSSGNRDLSGAAAALRAADCGLVVVVAGRLTAAQARQLAVSRRDGCPAIAVLLAVSTWANRQPRGAGQEPAGRENAARGPAAAGAAAGDSDKASSYPETAAAAGVLRAAGWRVTVVDARTPLALAWQRLPRFAGAAAAPGSAAAWAARPPGAAV